MFSGETTDLKYCVNVKLEENGFQMVFFWSKIGVQAAEISQFKDSRFQDFSVECHGMFTEVHFSWFSKAKRKHRN